MGKHKKKEIDDKEKDETSFFSPPKKKKKKKSKSRHESELPNAKCGDGESMLVFQTKWHNSVSSGRKY